MKIRRLACALLLTVAALVATSTTASATHTEVCVGQGAGTTTPLFYPGLGPDGSGGTFALTTLAATTVCTGPSVTIDVQGTFGPGPLAYCGHSTGAGRINWVHDFTYVGVGTLWIITGTPVTGTGTLAGVANVVADPLVGQNCLDGTSRYFVTVAAVFVA